MVCEIQGVSKNRETWRLLTDILNRIKGPLIKTNIHENMMVFEFY